MFAHAQAAPCAEWVPRVFSFEVKTLSKQMVVIPEITAPKTQIDTVSGDEHDCRLGSLTSLSGGSTTSSV
jgi:hypothetical protein